MTSGGTEQASVRSLLILLENNVASPDRDRRAVAGGRRMLRDQCSCALCCRTATMQLIRLGSVAPPWTRAKLKIAIGQALPCRASLSSLGGSVCVAPVA